MDFATWLQKQMDDREWSNTDLADEATLSRQAIGYYLGGRIPDRLSLGKIADALELPVELLYDVIDGKDVDELTADLKALNQVAKHLDQEDVRDLLDTARQKRRRKEKNAKRHPATT